MLVSLLIYSYFTKQATSQAVVVVIKGIILQNVKGVELLSSSTALENIELDSDILLSEYVKHLRGSPYLSFPWQNLGTEKADEIVIDPWYT